MNIFIYSDLPDDLQTYIKKQLPQSALVFFKSQTDQTKIKQIFENAEILLGNPPAGWFTPFPSNLKFWQLDSAGFDQYKSINTTIAVANMGNYYTRPCAETMIAGILAFYRRIHELVRFQDKKKWVRDDIRQRAELLSTKKVIILGTGTIGLLIKQILTGFGCTVKTTAKTNLLADLRSFEEVLQVLPETDLVINTLPGSADFYVSEIFFQEMKDGCLYASVGRGNTTDQNALIAALELGKIAGAVLDVTMDEPLKPDNKLWDMKNVILTQHTGGGIPGENEGKAKIFIANFKKYLNNEEIENRVSLARGY